MRINNIWHFYDANIMTVNNVLSKLNSQLITSLGLFFPSTPLRPISGKHTNVCMNFQIHTNMVMNLQIAHNNGKVPSKVVLSLELTYPPKLRTNFEGTFTQAERG